MPYRAVFTNAFLRGRRRLPDQAALRVVEAVKGLLLDLYVGTPLSEPFRGSGVSAWVTTGFFTRSMPRVDG